MTSFNGYYPITGIQDGLDPEKHQVLRKVHLRMEIDYWYQSPHLLHINQRALFFPAFWKFSQMEPHDKLSWFQIAGIHGKPFVTWDEPPQEGKSKDKGYCTHNSILFCTWHRPYLLLFEQVIYELMQEEVKKYAKSERDDLYEAARTWRMPYWDWAMKKPLPENPLRRDYNVPLVVLTKEVSIRLPTVFGYGTYPNAFYQFTMPGGIEMGDESLENTDPLKDLRITPSAEKYYPDPSKRDHFYPVTVHYEKCKATSRHPAESGVTKTWEEGVQYNAAIAQALRDYKWSPVENIEQGLSIGNPIAGLRTGNMTASLRDTFYRLLTIPRFEDFATMRAPGDGATIGKGKQYSFDSSENLHNNMHDWCGGPATKPDSNKASQMGHMAHVPLAAFDPMFWVHHSNVDRLIAIWQVLHEDSWFDGKDIRDQDTGSFAIDTAHPDKPLDPLRPFHKNFDGDYWTSADAREVTALDYTYPELEKWKYVNGDGSYDRDMHISALHEYLNRNYNSAWAAAEKAKLTDDPGQSAGIEPASIASLTALTKQAEKAKLTDDTIQSAGIELDSIASLTALTDSPGKRDRIELASMASLTALTKQSPMDLEIDDYVVNVVYEKFALGGTSFTIHIFVGPVPDELPYTTSQHGRTYVGEIFNFSSSSGLSASSPSSTVGCQNCRTQQTARAKSTGRVILTNALLTRFKHQVPHPPSSSSDNNNQTLLASMAPDHVIPFLKANLHWRVTSMGALIPLVEQTTTTMMPSLKVSVAVGKTCHYADRARLSVFRNYKAVYEITQRRPGNARSKNEVYASENVYRRCVEKTRNRIKTRKVEKMKETRL